MDIAGMVGYFGRYDEALAAGFGFAECREDLGKGTEALIPVDGRMQRGVVTRQGLSVFDVEYTTDRAIRDAGILLELTREAVRRGLGPAGYEWCADAADYSVGPLTTVVSVRLGDVMVRRSGRPWSPLGGPRCQGVTEGPAGPARLPAARTGGAEHMVCTSPGAPGGWAPVQGDVRTFRTWAEMLAARGVHPGVLVCLADGLPHVVIDIRPGDAFVVPLDGGDGVRVRALGGTTPADMLDPDPEIVRCWVPGVPRPKGSLKPRVSRTGGGRIKVAMVEQSKDSKSWRVAVQKALKAAYTFAFPTGLPVELEAVFVVERPESSQLPELIDPHVGDLDKLIRNIGDAAEGSGVLANDRQIVAITQTRKLWAPERHPEGAWIILREAR